MSTTDTYLPPTDEIDLSNDGIPSKPMLLTITDVEKQESNGNERIQLTFEGDELPFAHKIRYWTRHTSEQAQRAGRGALKRVTVAATGSPKFSPSALLGRQIIGTPGEDDRGFPTLKSVKSPSGVEVAA